MKRNAITMCLLAALLVSAGMTQDGCDRIDIPGALLGTPVIVVENATPDSRIRTMSVELTSYPMTRFVSWEFGDGAFKSNVPIAQGRSVTHAYTNNGTFVVRVHLFAQFNPVAGPQTLIATGELPIDVIGPNLDPTATFEVRNVLSSSGEPRPRLLEFDGSASADPDGAIVSFAWDFGDGTTSDSGAVLRHTYLTSGRFVAVLTVTDDRGATDSIAMSVVANISPIADFSSTDVSADPGNEDLTFAFDAGSSSDEDGTIVEFRWDFGDDTPEGTGQTVQHTFDDPAEYDVTLTITDDLGGSGMSTQTVDATGTEPVITEIDTPLGEIDAQVGIGISGFNFTDGSNARLVSPTAPDIIATSVAFQNDRSLIAQFDLTGAPAGLRSIVVTDGAAVSTTLPDSFQIVTATRVRMVTNFGDIVLELDPIASPLAVENFFQYVADGEYDGVVFHRVISGFVIQGGGFTSLGEGADPRLIERQPRPAIDGEAPNGRTNVRGTVAFALRGGDPNTATSQFFINLTDNLNLDNQSFTVFGEVVEGLESVVDVIAQVQTGTFNVTILDQNGNETQSSFMDVPVADVTVIRMERE